jgi:hypothetical protein
VPLTVPNCPLTRLRGIVCPEGFKSEKRRNTVSKLPPVPPDNLSHAGPGETARTHTADRNHAQGAVNPDQRGQQANTKINTTHQGYQQDR